jgi:hypothetical protein
MDVDLLQRLRSLRTPPPGPKGLVTCSLCLRVLRGSEWMEAERAIRELRTYELEALPRLTSGVCEACAVSIFSRRVAAESQAEAA